MKRLIERTEAQSTMADALRRYLRERYPFDAWRRDTRSGTGFPAALWRGLARDVGILGAAMPESAGGMGGGRREHAVIMEELGRGLAAEPYLSTVVIGGALLQHSRSPLAAELCERIVAGDAVLALAHGEPEGRHDVSAVRCALRERAGGYLLDGHKAVVRNAPWATHLLATAADGEGRLSLALVDPRDHGVAMRPYPTLDGGRAAEVCFSGVKLAPERVLLAADALPAMTQVIDDATLALCSEALGVMQRLFDDSLSHARERKQFGVSIASFQVLQHRLADMLMQLEQAVSITDLATASIGEAGSGLRAQRLVSSAKVTVGKACRFIGQNAIQIHGGMGMTDELAVGHYFKRATAIQSLFGPVDFHLRRYARATSETSEPPAPARQTGHAVLRA